MVRELHQMSGRAWWWRLLQPAAVLLFSKPSWSGGCLDSKHFCSQFSMLIFSDLGIFFFLPPPNLRCAECWSHNMFLVVAPYGGGCWLMFRIVPDPFHFQLWLWVSWSFGITCPNSSIVSCAIMFIGAISRPGISFTLLRGIGTLYPYLTSFPMSLRRSSGFADMPLWFPKVSTLFKLYTLSSLLILSKGHLLT